MITKKKILVIGDVMLDRYWMGQVNRISPEAPVPILDVNDAVDKPGGAANVAKNLSDFGMDVTLVGLTGNDEASEKLSQLLSKTNIKYKPIIDPKVRTTMKLRVIDKNQQLMRIDHEDKNLSNLVLKSLKDIESSMNLFDGIIISDYDKGMIKPIIKKILSKANKLGIQTFIDPKGKDFSFYKNAFLLKPNQKEFEDIVGICPTKKSLVDKGEKLRKKLSLKYLLLTQGKKGMILFEENKVTSHIAHQQDVFDVTGAGDTVISILATYVISGKSIATAVKMSNIAAGLSIKKLGSTSVSQKELNNASKK
ncbi:MAG: D-glycero-beta-D-manno-heptose-7-phosphate kinase [Pseudomonadota bacterium]|mgnify:FL=1|nr:D-glycero-beta-D-manno-heptose-7-phosphate kinase [Pseudomonadota bacterium]MED5502058.1 D-glycero-beta-D-manno-heptose-7-phosphate kinase [Pseudomonadota bacterium]